MLNSTDKRATIKTLLLYAIVIAIFIYGFDAFNQLAIIKANPQIKAVMALLLIVGVSFLRISTEFSFLICGILGSFIMGIPLSRYTEFLFKEASGSSIFMIAISGAVIAAISRNDLIDAVKNANPAIDLQKYNDLKHQSSIFCLFARLQSFIEKVKKKSKVLAAVVFFLQNILLFVSSVVSVQTFSAMFKSGKKKSEDEVAYINAGILCMCVSGCLLVFFFLKSPWWLFFLGLAKDVTINYPVAVLVYAFFSFVHGYYLISKSEKSSATVQEIKDAPHPLAGRHFLIYTGLIIVFLIFMLPKAIAYIGSADSVPLQIKQSSGLSSTSDFINIGISLVFIIIVAAILIATIITRRLMHTNIMVQNKRNTINEMKDLILGDRGIKSVISLIILIVTILSFRDMIKLCVSAGNTGAAATYNNQIFNIISIDGLVAIAGCLITLTIVASIGWILGSNFGAYSIGWIVFGILSAKLMVLNAAPVKRWALESIILVSTLCNQISPQSSNAGPLVAKLGDEPRSIQKSAWKVKSFWGQSALKIQIAAAFICVVMSGILVFIGIQ